jgi:hypothetical protein
MFCPRCANVAIEGQRFCKNCGMNLGLIVDALEGKRGPLDFELVKRDLRELGANLRAEFNELSSGLRGTAQTGRGVRADLFERIYKVPMAASPNDQSGNDALTGDTQQRDLLGAVEKMLRKVRLAHSRSYSLQQAVLHLLGGGAMLGVWYYVLSRITSSGLIESLEKIILVESGYEVVGIGALFRSLWMLALIPIATGIGHLLNGIFLVPKVEDPPLVSVSTIVEPPYRPPAILTSTEPPAEAQLEAAPLHREPVSVVEEQTLRLEREGK